MKKIYAFVFLISSFHGLLLAQENPSHFQLITKTSATWCGNCGGWGWDMLEGLIEQNEEKALIWTIHNSGDLANPTASAIASNFNFSGQPQFFFNMDNLGVTISNADAKLEDFKSLTDEAAAESPAVFIHTDAYLENNVLKVDASFNTQNEIQGDFYLATYLIDNSYIGYQSNRGNAVEHHKVLKTSFSSSAFGEMIGQGTFDSETMIEQTYSVELDTDWDLSKMEIYTIAWNKQSDGRYYYQNGNRDTDLLTRNSTTALDFISSEQLSASIAPTIVEEESILHLHTAHSCENISLSLWNNSGQLIKTFYQGNLFAGNHTFKVQNQFPAGMYFIRIHTAQGIAKPIKVIFK